MRRSITFLLTIVIVLINLCALAQAVPRSDNFNDNSQDSMWGLFGTGQGPANIHLEETNQRLEVLSTNDVDYFSLYGSVGWGLVTANDFQVKIDFYHYAPTTGTNFSQVLMTLIDTVNFTDRPESEGNYITLGAGYSGPNRIFYYERGSYSGILDSNAKLRDSNSGTLYISYNADLDALYLSDTGYGSANAWKTITGIIRGQWDRKTVGIGIGGYSDGVALTSGQAYLDNYIVDSGTLCDGLPDADLNEDCKVDFGDFAQFALQWLDCNMDPQTSCEN